MNRPASDSSEDLYSLNTTTADIFDFAPVDTFVTPKVVISQQTSKVTGFFSSIFNSLRNFFLGIAGVGFDFLRFLLTYGHYFQAKVLQLVHFLDVSKDRLVSTLMWRRGLLFRPATHGGVVVMAALALIAGGLFTRGQIAAQDLTPAESVLKSTNTTTTIVPTDRPRSEVLSYTVASGDTLSSLSQKFSVSVDSIQWENAMNSSDSIHPGEALKIPPVSGVVYTVKATDTIDSVAKAFSADSQTIADFPFNYVDDTLALKTGQTLYVPGGSIPAPKPVVKNTAPSHIAVSGSGFLSWPVPKRISQYFSWFHQAIDIANPTGTPIYAAHDGVITEMKKQTTNFGWYCLESFGDGWTIAYAHMSALSCYIGQQVTAGEYIGNVGMTGRATGPHLHFEVRHNGTAVDPMTLLP